MEKGFEEKVLDKLEELKIKVAVIETKVNDDLKITKTKAEDAYIVAMQNKKDLDELKEKHKWLARTVGAAIITALIGLAFSYIKFK